MYIQTFFSLNYLATCSGDLFSESVKCVLCLSGSSSKTAFIGEDKLKFTVWNYEVFSEAMNPLRFWGREESGAANPGGTAKGKKK
jgi:hypothetical protein